MGFWRQFKNPKVVAWTVLILLYLDTGLTYFLLKSWPQKAIEGNPFTQYAINLFGLNIALLLVLPAIFVFGSWVIYRYWYIRIIQLLAYLIVVTRLLVIPWHIYLAYAVFFH